MTTDTPVASPAPVKPIDVLAADITALTTATVARYGPDYREPGTPDRDRQWAARTVAAMAEARDASTAEGMTVDELAERKVTDRAARYEQYDRARSKAVDAFSETHIRATSHWTGVDPEHGQVGVLLYGSSCKAPGCDWSSQASDEEDDVWEQDTLHAADHVDRELPHVAALALADLDTAFRTDTGPIPARVTTRDDGTTEPTWSAETVLAAAGPWLHLARAEEDERARAGWEVEHRRAEHQGELRRDLENTTVGIMEDIDRRLRAEEDPAVVLADTRSALNRAAPPF